MKNKKVYNFKIIFLLFIIGIFSLGFIEGDKRGNKPLKNSSPQKVSNVNQSGKQGDSYRLNINNLNIPLNSVGTIADVNIPPDGTLGRFGNSSFLFSSGFFISGYTNGKLWAAAQATASLIENFVAGPVNSPNDPNAVMYVLKREDPPFGQSWQDWSDAVSLGADFYDGDGDGEYNPVDKNGNNAWDPDEDSPDLLGDELVWCIYNDGQPGAQRLRFAGIDPQGIEVRQSVFAFASKGALGNIMFVRYRFLNTGLKAEVLDSVYFGVWADPDLGDHLDDLVGVDVINNAGFVYNDGTDGQYGINPPAFMIDFFSGPISYIPGETFTDNNGNGIFDESVDTPIDTGYSNRGQIIGIKEFPGATNLGISSFVHYIQSDPVLGDPSTEFEARNYMLGLNKVGQEINPCNFTNTVILGGVDCSTINNRFWFSGDPVTQVGWINNGPTDQRQMQNTGPFQLKAGEELEITVAYVVGQGSDAISSITETRNIDKGAQFIFDQNFAAPSPGPTVNPTVEAGENFIDLVWETAPQVNYTNKTVAWDIRFEGFNVYAYRTNSTQATLNGQANSKLFASYDLSNFIQDIYKENSETGGIELLYPESDQLDYNIYSDSSTGRIRLRINQDPFTGGELVKGKPYYFAITGYYLNYEGLVNRAGGNFGDSANYYLSSAAFVGESENVPQIINFKGNNGIVAGENLYNPPILSPQRPTQVSGTSDGNVKYVVANKEALTGDNYKVEFFKDISSASYSIYWRLTNESSGQILIDSSKNYDFDTTDISGFPVEGFIPKVQSVTPTIGTANYSGTVWYDPFLLNDETGIYYVATDIPQARPHPFNANARSTVITAEKLRRVEIRFGSGGKAYRYLNGFIGTNLTRRTTYIYAAGVAASDTGGLKGSLGKFGEGFVDVPFTAWVIDERNNEERQLAVGFIERSSTLNGMPDGIWNPTDSIKLTGEAIAVFNSDYDPNGGQLQYTGDASGWADIIKGYTLTASGSTSGQKEIAQSPWFDAMYVVGIQKKSSSSFYADGDVLTIPIQTYPYTSQDIFSFSTPKAGQLAEQEKKELFEKVNVFPNPLYGYNVATSYTGGSADEPFVTFSNLPEEVTIKIYSLSGSLLRTLSTFDKNSPTSPFLRWDLQNETGLRVASGMYLAIVSSPIYGEKILKFAIIMPQKQIQKF